jgi:hypothetical protein
MNNRTALILISLLAMGQLPLVAQGLLLRTEWWRPNGVVLAVAIDSVNQVAYLGGDFTQLNNPDPPFSSVARQRLAAIDMSTGDVLPWNPGADGQVIALAVRGNNVFVGGQQVQCGGQTRPLLTVLDRTTGNATSWAPQVSGGYVKAFAFSTGKLYFTGGFTAVDGSGRAGAACFDLSTSTLTNWAPQPNDLIRTMVVHNGSVYLGGAFTTMNGEARDRTAQVDDEFGGLLSWSPSVTGGTGVFTMARQGSTLYLGGDLTAVNGQPRNFAAAVGTTGALASWNPAISQMVHSIVPFNGNIAMGGDFNDFTNMVVVNPTTASALTYSDINGQVYALASTTTHLIAGGSFNAVSNYPVTKLARVHTNPAFGRAHRSHVPRRPVREHYAAHERQPARWRPVALHRTLHRARLHLHHRRRNRHGFPHPAERYRQQRHRGLGGGGTAQQREQHASGRQPQGTVAARR